MDIGDVKKSVTSNLLQLAKQKGYITYDDILSCVDAAVLPIDEVERLCELIISHGVIIRDSDDLVTSDILDADSTTESAKYDKSQLNYNSIYKRALTIDKSLAGYIEKIKMIEPPQHGEESLLIHHAKEGNQFARDRIVTMFLKVALRIAIWHHEKFGYPLDETIQDANTGLLLAVEKFPLEKNYRYSTYAPWWVRQFITRKTQGVSKTFYGIPAHLKDKLINVIKVQRKHDCPRCSGFGSCANLMKEICDQMSIDQGLASYYLDLIRDPFSIEELVEEESQLLNDMGKVSDYISETIRLSVLKEELMGVLSLLKERERTVVELRYGLIDGEQRTLEEVGLLLGVTRERIRQIEAKAFGKIRNYSKKLNLFEEYSLMV
jgi:RNA polymerase primary sigma factor